LANKEKSDLNERQRLCLQIITELDAENERYQREEWAKQAPPGAKPPPESAWRWIQYDPSHSHLDPPLRQRLREAGMDGRGIKTTFKALWSRGLIRIRYERLARYHVLSAQLTTNGRQTAAALRAGEK
jgi:hypothetical protein